MSLIQFESRNILETNEHDFLLIVSNWGTKLMFGIYEFILKGMKNLSEGRVEHMPCLAYTQQTCRRSKKKLRVFLILY